MAVLSFDSDLGIFDQKCLKPVVLLPDTLSASAFCATGQPSERLPFCRTVFPDTLLPCKLSEHRNGPVQHLQRLIDLLLRGRLTETETHRGYPFRFRRADRRQRRASRPFMRRACGSCGDIDSFTFQGVEQHLAAHPEKGRVDNLGAPSSPDFPWIVTFSIFFKPSVRRSRIRYICARYSSSFP